MSLTLSMCFILMLLLVQALVGSGSGSNGCLPRYFDKAMVCVCDENYCDKVEPLGKVPLSKLVVYTSSQAGERLNRSVASFHGSSQGTVINRGEKFQSIIGFGGAFTDAAGINILSLPPKAQDNLLRSYYSPDGLEYTVGRIPMASCDFSTHPYSYDDTPLDFNLTHFALAKEDLQYKIPFIQKALEMNQRKMSIFGSPWSAPAWMKTNQNMTGNGTLIGQPGGKYYKTWAQYFVRFVQEYGKHNISLWGLTAQNEPTDGYFPHFSFQAMGWTPEQQRDFIKMDLGPALYAAGFAEVQLMILDDQRVLLPYWSKIILSDPEAASYVSGMAVHWYLDGVSPDNIGTMVHRDFPDFFILSTEACTGEVPWGKRVDMGSWKRARSYARDIIQIMSDPDARQYIAGSAVHWYEDFITPVNALDIGHEQFPDKFILATEACQGSMPWQKKVELGSWERARSYAHSILQDLNHWVSGWTDWNIALDMQGGPNWVSNFVDSPIIVNPEKGEFYKQPMFYALGHFSKFILPGAKRVALAGGLPDKIEAVALQNPDSSVAVVVLNSDSSPQNFNLTDPDLGSFNVDIPADAIQTYVYMTS